MLFDEPFLRDFFEMGPGGENHPEAALAAGAMLDECGCRCGDCQIRRGLAELGIIRRPGPWKPPR